MIFKIFTINNNKTLPTTTIIVMILIITGLLSNIPLSFSQPTSEIQKGYKNFLKGQTAWYDNIVSTIQSILHIIQNAMK